MRLGLNLETLDFDTTAKLDLARRADRLGFDSVWVAEAYGCDGVSPLGWLAANTSRVRIGTAVLQMAARTPTATAMTAQTVDRLSGGRVVLGLGASGPQVVTGWHGLPFDRPVAQSREYVEIVRRVLRRETVSFAGDHYRIPAGPGVKSLKLMSPPPRADVPVLLGALGPRNVALAAEVADGWIPVWFSPTRSRALYGPDIERPGFEVAPMVHVVMGDDVDACRAEVKAKLALYVGGMGSREQNFYNQLVRRYGFEEEAEIIQDLYLAGRREEAARAVPDELVDDLALCGPPGRIAELLGRWEASPATVLLCTTTRPDVLETLARLVDR